MGKHWLGRIIFLFITLCFLIGCYYHEPIESKIDAMITEWRVSSIKKEIAKEYPALLDETVSDFEKTNLLRDWAYAITVWGIDNFYEHYDSGKNLKQNFVSLTEGFQNFEISAYCGGTAAYMALVYDAFGYEAISLNCALFAPDGSIASHVVTLCKIQDGREEKWIVQDPTFNRVYVDADGTPLDIYELMTLLKENRSEEIHYAFGDTQARYIVLDSPLDQANLAFPADITPNTLDYYPYLSGEIVEINGRYGVPTDMRQPGSMQRKGQAVLESVLPAMGYPAEIDYLYLFPYGLNIGNVANPGAMLTELQAFAAN